MAILDLGVPHIAEPGGLAKFIRRESQYPVPRQRFTVGTEDIGIEGRKS